MHHALKGGSVAAIFLLAWLAILPASAQDVYGHVLDERQEPLPGVEVQLINLGDAQVLRRSTGPDGGFLFEAVPSGKYSLTLLHTRYSAWRSVAFEVLPGIPVSFPPIELQQLPAPLTRPRSGLEEMALEYGLVREQIEALPVVVGSEGRTTVDKLLHLVPGLTPATALDIDPFTGRAAAVSANGSRSSFINYKLEGASNNAQNRITGAQAANYGPVPEAIESLQVITHTYSAREGRNAGAVVAPRFRSGADRWHGHVRGYMRPPWNESYGAFDGSVDRVAGWTGGGQLGGPLHGRHQIHAFLDAEAWATDRSHQSLRRVLSDNERSGNFFGFEKAPVDPLNGEEFPNAKIPPYRLDPLMQSYLNTFVPPANLEGGWLQSEEDLRSYGGVLLARVDARTKSLNHSLSHYAFSNTVREPTAEEFTTSPGTVRDRRQISHHAQYAVSQELSPHFVHSLRLALQRLSSEQVGGHRTLRDVSAEEFGFDYSGSDVNPTTIPDVRLWHDTGQLQLYVGPFIHSENSVQTTLQLLYDLEVRFRRQLVRAGLMAQRGSWPFANAENSAGSFSFPAPPAPPARFRGQGLRDLLLGRPGEYRLQTPRSMDLQWREFAAFAEAEIRPWRDLKVTFGMRYENQPPGTDRWDRLMTFREGTQSRRFPESLPNLLFPGDMDPEGNVLPRSTIRSRGRNFSPRIGLAFSPSWDGRAARWILGESGRSVLRAAYGVFFDHGTFAGSSAAALFQATYPPFSVDNRFALRDPQGAFQAPIAALPSLRPTTFRPDVARYPILVFAPDFENARAEHWNFSWQRLLPGRVFLTGSYLGTRSRRLQQQRELNVFVRNPLRSFGSVRNMRKFSRFDNVRSFESSGGARYKAVQLRANRYLHRGLALDVGYNWSQSFDNGSTVLGDELVGEEWTYSNFDRRHSLTAVWHYQVRMPRRWTDRARWADRWVVSGIWRWRSGLPLDIRQTEDPTYTFERVGRPDRIKPHQRLDPGSLRTFPTESGQDLVGRFAFDPTSFQAVRPRSFHDVRRGTSTRNEYRIAGFQQWDFRISRPVEAGELVSMELGFDVLNAFGNRNWAAPFNNIDHVYFGVARMSGLGRTLQAAIRLRF
ncbi:MAG: carboxypeptidase regulatory-like domain-containing protein [Bryobacterales bacterium]|nr:carboxypeptidase regulatory-like domain-containing protein [Bryobacterales bacterium]